MPRRNRVDPWGDLYAVGARGLFTGNRGCIVNDQEDVVRHHGAQVWITCKLKFRDWRWPLARPKRWTPIFFLDEAVALAAGHRPCATCRREDYKAYRDAVGRALDVSSPLLASEINALIKAERLRSGRGLVRAGDRILWQTTVQNLPDGAIVIDDEGDARLLCKNRLLRFTFDGWEAPRAIGRNDEVQVLTPPTSIAALKNGYAVTLHPSAS